MVAGDDEAAAALLEPAVGADQHAEARGVDERGPGQVDDEALDAGGDRRHHALLELGRGEEVDLAGDGDDVGVGVDAAVLDRELDGHRLARFPAAAVLVRPVGEPDVQVLRARPRSRLEMSSASCSITLPTPGTAASTTSARPPPARSGPTRRNERAVAGLELDVDGLGARRGRARARRSGRRPARRRRAGRAAGRRARRACRPRGAGPGRPAGPLAIETRVVPGEPFGLAAASLTPPRSPARRTSRPGCPRSPGACEISRSSVSAAISGSPRPGPPPSGLGRHAATAVLDDPRACRAAAGALDAQRALVVRLGRRRRRGGRRWCRPRSRRAACPRPGVGQRELLGEGVERAAHHRDVAGASGKREADRRRGCRNRPPALVRRGGWGVGTHSSVRIPGRSRQLTGFRRLGAGRRATGALAARPWRRCSFARAHSQEKPVWRKSLPAEAASTAVTVRPARGACRRSATSPSALQAPMQRVQFSSSPTA